MKKDTFLTTVPFAGFYCSIHDEGLEYTLARYFDYEGQGDGNSDLIDAARDAIDWRCVHEAYAVEYVAGLRAEYDVELAFESLSSPAYYNFETDRVFAHIDRDSLARIAKAIPRDRLRKAVKERFTSRSGFMSHYPADLSSWPARLSDWDHNQIGLLLELYLDQEASGYGSDGLDSFKQYEVMESAFGNGYVENWFHEHERRGYEGTMNRLDKIGRYLAERDQRTIKTMSQFKAARRSENRPFDHTPLGAWVC